MSSVDRQTILRELGTIKPSLEKRFRIRRIGVFGSVARDDAGSSSDIDIVVDMAPDLFMRAELKADLESFLGRKVDVVRYRDGMNKYLKQRIDREAVYV
jgi:predicted nucleotidyltransferase